MPIAAPDLEDIIAPSEEEYIRSRIALNLEGGCDDCDDCDDED